MPEKKILVSMKFKSLLAEDEVNSIVNYRDKQLQNTDGLISLLCHRNRDKNLVGGTFIFKNLELAQKYVDRFLLEGRAVKYKIVPDSLKIEIDELEDILDINNI